MANKAFKDWYKEQECIRGAKDIQELEYLVSKRAWKAGQKSMSLEGDEHIIWMHGYNKGKKEAEKRVAERCINIIEQRLLAIDIPSECIKAIKKEFLDE